MAGVWKLTSMETKVLKYRMQEYSYKEICTRSNYSHRMVDNALNIIRQKLYKYYKDRFNRYGRHIINDMAVNEI